MLICVVCVRRERWWPPSGLVCAVWRSHQCHQLRGQKKEISSVTIRLVASQLPICLCDAHSGGGELTHTLQWHTCAHTQRTETKCKREARQKLAGRLQRQRGRSNVGRKQRWAPPELLVNNPHWGVWSTLVIAVLFVMWLHCLSSGCIFFAFGNLNLCLAFVMRNHCHLTCLIWLLAPILTSNSSATKVAPHFYPCEKKHFIFFSKWCVKRVVGVIVEWLCEPQHHRKCLTKKLKTSVLTEINCSA